MMKLVHTVINRVGRPIPALSLALAIAWIVIAVTGSHPGEAFGALFSGAMGSPAGLLRTLAKATPLILAGLAVSTALRAGLFNIGGEGQILVGGLVSAIIGASLPVHIPVLHVLLAMGGGAFAGAAWAWLPGFLRAKRGAHEVITTIMMNYLAILATHYLVNGPLKDPDTTALATRTVANTAKLWSLNDVDPTRLAAIGNGLTSTNFSAGILLCPLAAYGYWFLFRKTALGYEMRAVGGNSAAARAVGIPVERTLIKAMLISGALAGLAGSVEVLGVHRRFLDSFSPGYGFDSIAVALLGSLGAPGICAAAILFGALSSGAIQMEIATEVPRQISGIIQGVVILTVGAKRIKRGGSEP